MPLLLQILLPWPRSWLQRMVPVIFFTWFTLVLYCATILFPIGTEWAELHGLRVQDYYDNNNFVPIFFCGWIYPAWVAGGLTFLRFLKRIVWGNFSSRPVWSNRGRSCQAHQKPRG